MKYFRFHSVRVACFVSVLFSLLSVLAMNAISLLVVNDESILIRNAIIVLATQVIAALTLWWREHAKANAQYYVYRDLHHALDQYYVEQGVHRLEEVGRRSALYTSDIPKLSQLTLTRMFNMITNGTAVIFIFISLCAIHWIIGLLGLAAILCNYFVSKILQKDLSVKIAESQETNKWYLGKLSELFRGFRALLTSDAAEQFYEKSQRASEQYADRISNIDVYAGKISSIISICSTLCEIAILFVLSLLVIRQLAPAAYLLSALALVSSLGETSATLCADYVFFKSGQDLYQSLKDRLEHRHHAHFLRPWFRRITDLIPRTTPALEKPAITKIETKNLSISFGEHRIHFPDLTFEKGKKYAILGPSGCGKSTLLKLINGQSPLYNGEIWINGKVKLPTETEYDRMTYIDQENFVFQGTVEENISLAASVSQPRALLDSVYLQDFQPQDFIDENGENISGGQKQRLTIARGLARQCPVLLLDEITAHLDPATKRQIAGRMLQQEAMVLMVAHDLPEDILAEFDHCIYLEAQPQISKEETRDKESASTSV